MRLIHTLPSHSSNINHWTAVWNFSTELHSHLSFPTPHISKHVTSHVIYAPSTRYISAEHSLRHQIYFPPHIERKPEPLLLLPARVSKFCRRLHYSHLSILVEWRIWRSRKPKVWFCLFLRSLSFSGLSELPLARRFGFGSGKNVSINYIERTCS